MSEEKSHQRFTSKYETDGSSRIAKLAGNEQIIEARIKDAEKKIAYKEKSKRRLKDEIAYLQVDYERVQIYDKV